MATAHKPYGLTGGLRWHWRGWRRQRDWADFRRWLASVWGGSGKPDPNQNTSRTAPMLVLGPSAGWTLPAACLLDHNPLICVDIDPWAPHLFKRNHSLRNHTVAWLQQDFMATLPDLLAQWPDATLLFANCLGQQGLLNDDPSLTEAQLRTLSGQLQDRRWFSYHDRLSLTFQTPPAAAVLTHLQEAVATLESRQIVSTPDLIDALRLGELATVRLKTVRDGANAPGVPGLITSSNHQTARGLDFSITDHLTADLLPPGSLRRYALLPVSGTAVHIIEAGWVVYPVARSTCAC